MTATKASLQSILSPAESGIPIDPVTFEAALESGSPASLTAAGLLLCSYLASFFAKGVRLTVTAGMLQLEADAEFHSGPGGRER